jgi:hypothetical protein
MPGARLGQEEYLSSSKAVFSLPKGKAVLEAGIQQQGQPRTHITGNSAIGDIRASVLPD